MTERSRRRAVIPAWLQDTRPRRAGVIRRSRQYREHEEVEFFPREGERLFGCTHLPRGHVVSGLVICPALHAEFPHNYRKEVVLARTLAAAGIAVQRFHYRGTGNSDGDATDVTLASMVDDALASLALLRRKTGIEHPAVLGTRLGALVAAAARRESNGPLVLWEPVLDPADYFRDLFRAASIRELRQRSRGDNGSLRRDRAWMDVLDTAGSVDILGYSLHQQLYQSLHGRGLLEQLGERTCRVLLLQLDSRADIVPRYSELIAHLRASGFAVDANAIRADEHWWFSGNPDHSFPTLKAVVAITTDWLNSQYQP